MRLGFYIIATIVITLLSCSNSVDSSRYRMWFDNNESFSKKKVVGSYTFSVKYTDGLYNYLSTQSIDTLPLEELANLKNTHCFFLEILSNNEPLEITQISEGKVSYLMSEVQKDFSLQLNNETIPCSLHHFERVYGLKGTINLIAIFYAENSSMGDLEFSFDDRLLNTGRNTFRFEGDILKTIPNIKSQL